MFVAQLLSAAVGRQSNRLNVYNVSDGKLFCKNNNGCK